MDLVAARTMRNPQGPSTVLGRTVASERIVEAFRYDYDSRRQRLSLAGADVFAGSSLHASDIDTSWLEAASESYRISADPRDYVLVDIPIVTVDFPNRNMQAFPYEEMSYFDPLYGKLVYQTFDHKPCHQDHDNKDPLKAKGVIFDATLQRVPAYNTWKARILAGWDRTKDNWLVDQILTKKRTGYSMGALVENFVCSTCGAIDTNVRKCRCMDERHGGGKGSVSADGHLRYQLCVGVNFIENSSVDDPADITADTESILG